MTLTQTAVLTKQVITITILALILGVASFIGYNIWYTYYLAHLPPKVEKPDTKFGLLPPPDFPKAAVSSSNFSYSIDTTTGGLPIVGVDKGFEKLIRVYFVVKTYASLLSSEKSQNLAEKFDLKVNPQILSETNYLFKDKDKSLNVDLDSGNFTYQKVATPSAGQSLDDEGKLVSDFKGVLTNLGVLKPDLNIGRNKVIFLKNGGGELAQISLWQAPLDDKPIMTPELNKSLINATVYKAASDIQNYLTLNFTYYPIDTSTFATYPLKTSEQAFEDLKSGKGLVVIEPLKPNVSITSAYLSYYLSESYNPYLLPMFIFEGPNFAAYVPAITAEFQSPTR
ncbi:MAG: Uncharacterized protein G01um10147_918 [Microgenomates group bacterium Gr01-1014_7]|nr:MAG: Uncharacterized protein G01um10147_918 [Microgenomates group bacterium Gr01-1014_7]